jgi:dTDP-4-amino-4,6-dideoxygalactose transaminase
MPLEACVCQGQGEAMKGKPGTVFLPFSCHAETGEHTWNQFVIRVLGSGKRDALKEKLNAQGIQTEVYYPRSMHEQECFADQKKSLYPEAEAFAKETLALPLPLFI